MANQLLLVPVVLFFYTFSMFRYVGEWLAELLCYVYI